MASDLSSLTALCTPTSFLGMAIDRGAVLSPINWTHSIALKPLDAWVADHLDEFPGGRVTQPACEPVFTALNLGVSDTTYDEESKKTLQDQVQSQLRTMINAARIQAWANKEDATDSSTNTKAPLLIPNDEDEDKDGDDAASFYKGAAPMHDQEPHHTISSAASPSQPSLWQIPHRDPSTTLAHGKSGVSTGTAWAQNTPASVKQTPPSATAPYPSKDTEPRHGMPFFGAPPSTPSSQLHQRPNPTSATLANIRSGASTGAAAWAPNVPAKVEQTPPSALHTRGRTEAEEQRAAAAHYMGKILVAAAAVGEKKAAEAAAKSRANEKREQLNALFSDFFAQHGHNHEAPSERQVLMLMEDFQEKTRKAVDECNRAEQERMELWHDCQMAKVAGMFCRK